MDCIANTNLGTNAACSVYGYRVLSGSHNNIFTQCIAKGNQGGALTVGFSFDTSNYTLMQSCYSMNNGGSAAAVHGIQSTGSCKGALIAACKIHGNTSTAASAYGISLSNETGSTIQYCEIKANDGGSTAVLSKGYGIAMLGTCINNTVEYNKIFANVGVAKQYGFNDAAADCTTMLRGNVAFGQGQSLNGAATTLTDSGSMNYYFSYAEGGSMSVQNLIKERDVSNMNAFGTGDISWLNYSILPNIAV